MRYVVAGLIGLLIVLHQDYWQWNKTEPMVLDFIPFNLAWQVGISLGAAAVWILAINTCWPSESPPAQPSAAEKAS